MKIKLYLILISLFLILILISSCAPSTAPDTESLESGTEAQTEEVKEAEYSVTAFDQIDPGVVKQIVISDCNALKKLVITDADKISEIVELVNGVKLTYTGMTSEGVYDTRVNISIYNEYGNEAYSSINLHGGSRCEYKVNRKSYYETGSGFFSIYDMTDGKPLFEAVSEYLPIE